MTKPLINGRFNPPKPAPLIGAPEHALKMTRSALEMADLSTQSDARKNHGR